LLKSKLQSRSSSPQDVATLAAWLEEYQQMVNASAEIFSIYDKEEAP